MKIKHLLIGMLAMAAAVACKQDEPVEEPSLEVNKTAVALAATAGEATFNVTANNAWSAEADADWVSLDPASGAGEEKAATVKVTADDNTAEARTATVTVKSGNLTRTVKVTQAAAEASEEPGDEPGTGDEPGLTLSDWAIVGSFTGEGWGWDAAAGLSLYVLDENYFVYYGLELAEGAQWKFLQGGAWGGAEVGADRTSVEPNTIQAKGSTNIYVTTPGKYDIYLSADATKYYVMSEGKTPADATEPSAAEKTYTVTGTIKDSNWDNMGAAGLMAQEDGYYVAKNVPFVTAAELYGGADQIEFKICNTGSWDGAYGLTEDAAYPLNTEIAVTAGGEKNIAISAAPGTYDVYFDEANAKVWVMTPGYKPGDEIPGTEDPEPENPEPEQPELEVSTWNIVGSFTGSWNPAAGLALSVLDENYFVYYGLELAADAQWKFLQGTSWGSPEVGANRSSVEPNTIQAKGGTNIYVNTPGTYDIYLAADASKFYVMSEGKTPAEATEPAPAAATYTVTGTIQGHNWDNMAAAGLMTEEGGYYVAKNVPFVTAAELYGGADQIEFKICNTGSWDAAYGAPTTDPYNANAEIPVAENGNNVAVAAPSGAYDVYFDKENGKVWVMEPGLKPGETPAQPEPEPTPDPELPDATKVVEFNMSETGWPNKYNYVNNEKYYINDDIAFRFRQGNSSTAPTYISDGEYIKMFQNGSTFEVMSNEHTDYVESKYTIKSIEITFAQGHCYLSPDSGELSAEGDVRTWTGNAVNVKFTANGTDSSHRAYVKAIKVVYEAL